jgi:proline iminopeptidase
LERWSLIGHSYGGYIAAAYLEKHPERIDRVVFENPTFDLASSARHLLVNAALLYRESGDIGSAEEAEAVAQSDADPLSIWASFTRLTNGLGAARQRLYFHSDPTLFDRVVASSNLGDQWGRGMGQQRALFAEGSIFDSRTGPVSSHDGPMLLIHGLHDSVTAPDQIAAFCGAPTAWLAIFQQSSHFVHLEEPDVFATTVEAFLAGHPPPSAELW